MGKINTTNYPNRPVSAYQDDDMFILQDNGGETYTTNVGDIKDLIGDETDPKLALKVDKNGTDRLMTAAEGTKLAGIAAGAQVNVLEGVQVNGTDLSITNKKVNVDISGKTDLKVIAFPFHDPVEGEPQMGFFKGAYVTYNGKLYEFTQEHQGAWNPSHVKEITVDGMFVRAGNGGYNTGDYSTTEGHATRAEGEASHAEGLHTIANSDNQHVEGKYNIADTDDKYALIVGNGTADNARSNAMTLDWDGNLRVSGDISDGNGDVTVEGNPVTFESPFEQDAKSVVVTAKPIQDLHGYDHPWSGGAGKNKLPMTVSGIKAANTTGTWSGNAYTLNGVTFTIQTDSDGNITSIKANGTASGAVNFNLSSTDILTNGESYIINGCPLNGSYSTYSIGIMDVGRDYGAGLSFTSVSAKPIFININNGYTATNLIFTPMIRLATESDATFAPYSNICPISGIDEVEIGVSGKNNLPLTLANLKTWNTEGTWVENTYTTYGVSFTCYTNDDDAVVRIHAEGTSGSTPGWLSLFKNGTLDIGQTSILSGCPAGGSDGSYVLAGFLGNPYRWYIDYGNGVDIPQDIDFEQVYIEIKTGYAIPSGGIDFYPMIRLATESDPTFEPYNPNSHTTTIPLPSTLYGGTVDVNTGEVTEDWTYKAITSSDSFVRSFVEQGYAYYRLVNTTAKPNAHMMCNGLKAIEQGGHTDGYEVFANQNGDIFFILPENVDVNSTIKDVISIAYELATPTTLSLTPTDVELLEGTNVVTTNGEKVAVTFGRSLWQDIDKLKTDTEGKLDKSDVADAEGDTASRPYAVNEFMLRSDGLYKVTQPIASGASITSSNTTKTTIGAVLTALLNA